MYELHKTGKFSNWYVLYHFQDVYLDLYIRSDLKITWLYIDAEQKDLLDSTTLSERILDRINYAIFQLKKDNDMLWNFKYCENV